MQQCIQTKKRTNEETQATTISFKYHNKSTKSANMKSTKTYWNPLASDNSSKWEIISGSEGNLFQIITIDTNYILSAIVFSY